MIKLTRHTQLPQCSGTKFGNPKCFINDNYETYLIATKLIKTLISDLSTSYQSNSYFTSDDLFDRYAQAREIMRLDLQIEGNLIILGLFGTIFDRKAFQLVVSIEWLKKTKFYPQNSLISEDCIFSSI